MANGAGAMSMGMMAMPVAGVALAAATTIGKIGKKLIEEGNKGAPKALSSDAKVFQAFGKTNHYGSNLNLARKEWHEIGKNYGYSSDESVGVAQAFMKQAGYGDMKSLQTDVKAVEWVSKAYGLDPDQTADTVGMLNKMGIFSDGDQRKFINTLSDAIERNGMRGREDEQIEIMRSIADNLYTNRLTVSQEDLMSSLNLQSKMVQVNEAFKGEKGADTVAKLDNMVTGGNHSIDLF